jgi:2-phosphosulfolactate phosphatase
MKITLIPSIDYIRENDIKGKTVVIIDVLRATSVIVTALANGAKEIFPVIEVEEAFSRKTQNSLLGGERKALKIEGFDLSNSPLDYKRELVTGKTIILSTTNGTKAIHYSINEQAKEVLTGSMLNAKAVAGYLAKSDSDIAILCAGTYGEFSLDDFICAGKIVWESININKSCNKIQLDDFSMAAVLAYESNRDRILEYVSNASHYKYLLSIGLKQDIEYCFSQDLIDLVPKISCSNGNMKISV